MAKTKPRGRRVRRQPTALEITARRERQQLRRYVQAKRDLVRFTHELRRATERADAAALALLHETARRFDLRVVPNVATTSDVAGAVPAGV